MVALRDLLTKSGLKKVQTYIQSGNVIFQSSGHNALKLEKTIHTAILEHFQFKVPVIVKTRDQLLHIFENCPFPDNQKENSYFILLSKIPDAELVFEVRNSFTDNEVIVVINDCLYFYSSTGYGRTKFNMNTIEKKLKISATSRNYKTMVKLLSLSENF